LLSNQRGKVVSSSEVDSVKQVKANVSALPQGYYLLSVQTNQGLITKPSSRIDSFGT